MPHLRIRKLEDEILKLLRIRATKHQVSMEEEARRIICEAVMPPENIGSLALSYFGEKGYELALPKRETYKPENFD